MRPTCLSCSSTKVGDYCGRCRQSIKTARLNTEWVLENLSEVALHLKRNRLFRTFAMMLLDPAKVVFEYIAGHRVIWHPPISYFVLSALIYKLLFEWILKKNGWEPGRFAHMTSIQLLLTFAAISLVAYMLLLRPRYNFIESVVVVCYIYGTIFLVAPILAILLQAPFPGIADNLNPPYRPLLVDGWSILLAIYMAIRIIIKAQASLLRLGLVTSLTFSLYYFQNIDLEWWRMLITNHLL